MVKHKKSSANNSPSNDVLREAFRLMATAKSMNEIYEKNRKHTSKYVHATSRGHEAIQIAVGMQLRPQDFLSLYYRDDAFLLSIGMQPYDLMLQLMAKKDDPFSGGRSYYCHPSLRDDDKPKIIHQSSATGMQAIPTTGIAMGIRYKEIHKINEWSNRVKPVVVCSLGDASITEGEVAEAFQMAALKQLPILYVIQDNGWDISAYRDEVRSMNAAEYIRGFKGITCRSVDGSDFKTCYKAVSEALGIIRKERRPLLLHVTVPLLTHHTSGVRMEWYRDDLDEHRERDPYPVLRKAVADSGRTEKQIQKDERNARKLVESHYERALNAPDPEPGDLFLHDFAPTQIIEETGERAPAKGETKVMVDCALFAIRELMEDDPNCLLYGQDVGARLGGVFREAATLAQEFGDERVFNTPIQEAFIVGSTVGMSAVGLKPIVEVQFGDYIWPGLNQLFSEVSRSCFLTNGKWPVNMILRVPIGAYGSGGPYHSSSIESVVCNIRGLKIAYPSNGADLKGLMKAAYHDPNPCIMFEHKGLYWSKVPGTEMARSIEPARDYILPFGKGLIVQPCAAGHDSSLTVITYGMGVHWALNAAKEFPARVEIVDLRTLHPLDTELIYESVRRHHRALVVTEEPVSNSFAQSVAARIQEHCFESLDAPVRVIGAEDLPAVPLNVILEKAMIPSAEKVQDAIEGLLSY